MSKVKPVRSALISVFNKEGLEPILDELRAHDVAIYSTGGTQKFIEDYGCEVIPVEALTAYPSILGGRVKTLHPKIFGGILGRRENDSDIQEMQEYQIPEIDLVIVDLYPFEDTVAQGLSHQEIIEKIDIGGISLIRGAAKNFNDVAIVASKQQYGDLLDSLKAHQGGTTEEVRRNLATSAFNVSSHYDTAIFNWFNQGNNGSSLKLSETYSTPLRYGENPHQAAAYYGNLDACFEQLNGKELSYNNLLDLDAALALVEDFGTEKPVFAVIKHNNACGFAQRNSVLEAWKDALAGDPVSAFGGILACNQKIDKATAEEVNKLFFEILVAPDFDADALEILAAKKNRRILKLKDFTRNPKHVRTVLNGYLVQDIDNIADRKESFELKTKKAATEQELLDMEFANKLVKHTKSNAIVLVKNGQLLASGTGQTSRVDALQQAIHKAGTFNFSLEGAVMASDAFFPFPDCVEIAHKAGITAVIQPGGSIKDELSIKFCDDNGMAMVFTGNRHFKH
ncbi:bifunctional phosphoribosylaminoimidazolecarboxamide formyltransferase/IMP cyclohydrolase [Luteibaculum oceani]|uniref:Bifunctional purine biosynthesis protein PurH n=1 Tax=Luteibaculum oceani TaxID=1294296 RepID=A0A5C6UX85_9FLAO|nr:bifunctional phosphoribosylaminoimidazolecarboxamide formyltransferase/IMP cyclohydrolase [Luteibaculum oceani]TXC75608.1 bifunctional phosphoribosylaminoimidazolecarboxamide formyltransferase/IMP cyclohydrolase [Luteibaculum oceani]